MRLENICKSFDGKPVLQNVSMEIGAGVTCLMAPSGIGKTTLLRILLGLEQPDSGRLTDLPKRWSVVFQEDRLLERLSAMDNLRFALGEELSEDAAAELLKRLGLDPQATGAVATYSGGMKRRLALARALLAKSDALALDEPFTGLDEENRKHAMDAIRSAAEGRPILLISHDPQDAVALSAKILHLS